ncbi:MAG: Rrf2 family transcriptional regulator [Bacteroidales bacterium]|nr:Rrf2 family transcriptional regulator [Bacteroidales bacterium]
MKFNTKTRYGIRAMIELALNNNQEGIYQKDIAQNQEISFKYLDQIISSLKSAGLVTTVGGKKSGYRLKKDPGKITIYDIYKAFNSELEIIECLGNDEDCLKEKKCAARNFWHGLNDKIIEYLQSVHLDELVEEQQKINESNQEITFSI